MSWLRKWGRHPLVIVPPLVIAAIVLWQQHTLAGRTPNLPMQNILAANSNSAMPTEWELTHSGDSTSHTTQAQGYVSSKATTVTIDQYKNGDVLLTSPKVTLNPNQSYLFKGYYTSDTPFVLLAHYFYSDGTDTLLQVNDYPAQRDRWSTISHAFRSEQNITAIQFELKLAHKGSLTIDGVYLEPRQDILVPAATQTKPNLIPNRLFATSDTDMPDDWNMYRAGDNNAQFTTTQDDGDAYLKIDVTDYKNGEAKWEHESLPIKPLERHQFQAEYMGDAPVKVIAEYLLDDGSRHFDEVANLAPASQWTKITQSLEAPARSVSFTTSIVLQSNGTLASRNYSLTNITRPGPSQWKRPIVSITFDDGWLSAYTNAIPVLDHYGYKATFYINPSSIETPGFMRASELAKLGDAKHEIAAHGYGHKDMTSISNSAINDQLRGGKDYLKEAGFPTDHFATPYGKTDAEVQWLINKYYKTSRGLDSGINTRQNIDPLDLRSLYVNQDTSSEFIARLLDEAKQSNGWFILSYHNIGSQPDPSLPRGDRISTVTSAMFANHISQIQKSGVTVLPINAAYTEVSGQ
jgi:peptidoglycan/xylan/chitin deacetylase (PgdA/CDA1 family)